MISAVRFCSGVCFKLFLFEARAAPLVRKMTKGAARVLMKGALARAV